MDKQAQDKLWNELSEEEKKKYSKDYKEAMEDCGESALIVRRELLAEIFGSHNLNPKPQPLTYEDVARELFGSGIDEKQQYALIPYLGDYDKWRKKLEAIGKLLVVAKFLNKNWKPDWEKVQDEEEIIYGIGLDPVYNEVTTFMVNKDRISSEIVYFRTKELAKQAIQILGEDTVRLALTTEY